MSSNTLTLGAGNTLFISDRRKPLERSNVCKMVNNFAKAAGLSELNVHPHMLRHSCGYDLANRGVDTRCVQEYLGHVAPGKGWLIAGGALQIPANANNVVVYTGDSKMTGQTQWYRVTWVATADI